MPMMAVGSFFAAKNIILKIQGLFRYSKYVKSTNQSRKSQIWNTENALIEKIKTANGMFSKLQFIR